MGDCPSGAGSQCNLPAWVWLLAISRSVAGTPALISSWRAPTMPLRHRGGRCRGVILQTPSGAVLASLIVNPGDAIIVIPTGRQTPLDGDDDGPQVSNHHCHTARTSTVLPGQRRKNRQAAAGRTVRRHSATAAIDGDPDRPPRRPRATRRKGKELISRVGAGRCELCEQRAESTCTTSALSPTSPNRDDHSQRGPSSWRNGDARPSWSADPATTRHPRTPSIIMSPDHCP